MAGGGCGNETAAHHSILWAGGIPSVWMASLLFCCLVLFTTVWEYLTELLEHRVAGHHGYQELLEKVYKELTSLGVLSFALFIIQDTSVVQINHDLLVAFEFAHYLIFFMALLFVLFALVSMRGCLATKRQWDTTAATSVHAVCVAYTHKLQRRTGSRAGCFLSALGLWDFHLQFCREQQAIEWFLLRVLFLREYGVQIHFDFAKYARKSLTHSIMRGIEITPATWAFMLACLLIFAAADLAHQVELRVDDAHRRLAGGEDGSEAGFGSAQSGWHIGIMAGATWLALLVQSGLLLLLRRRQRLLLQRKLHMHGWSDELVAQLKDGVQRLQMQVMHAETRGHDHLPSRHESSMDDEVQGSGLRETYETGAYSPQLGKRVRWMAHCVSMWSCFSLAYYLLDLVVIVHQQNEWGLLNRLLAHLSLLLPHVIGQFLVTPEVMKHESLLSCVVRREDEIVATVIDRMEMTDRLCEGLRTKLVDAHRQTEENYKEARAAAVSRELDTEAVHQSVLNVLQRTKSANPAGLQPLVLTSDDVTHATQEFFKQIGNGDSQIALKRLRIGLHKINAYFTERDWKALCRLLDRNHTKSCTLEDLLAVIKPGQGHWRDRSETDPSTPRAGRTPPKLRKRHRRWPMIFRCLCNEISESELDDLAAQAATVRWMYEDVADIDTTPTSEPELTPMRRSVTAPTISMSPNTRGPKPALSAELEIEPEPEPDPDPEPAGIRDQTARMGHVQRLRGHKAAPEPEPESEPEPELLPPRAEVDVEAPRAVSAERSSRSTAVGRGSPGRGRGRSPRGRGGIARGGGRPRGGAD